MRPDKMKSHEEEELIEIDLSFPSRILPTNGLFSAQFDL